jgi:hypothetical protein
MPITIHRYVSREIANLLSIGLFCSELCPLGFISPGASPGLEALTGLTVTDGDGDGNKRLAW